MQYTVIILTVIVIISATMYLYKKKKKIDKQIDDCYNLYILSNMYIHYKVTELYEPFIYFVQWKVYNRIYIDRDKVYTGIKEILSEKIDYVQKYRNIVNYMETLNDIIIEYDDKKQIKYIYNKSENSVILTINYIKSEIYGGK